MNKFIIDVATHDKNRILRRLINLKSVEIAIDGGMYHQDKLYSQIHILTSMTDHELDNWLYSNNFDYVGLVPSNAILTE